jgi:hypothetical protein
MPAMANLTLSVDEQLIRRARVRAIEERNSLSAKVREFLLGYVDESPDAAARQRVEATTRVMAAMDAGMVSAARGAAPAAVSRGRKRTLREQIYEGDFRAHDRAVAATGGPARAGRAVKSHRD